MTNRDEPHVCHNKMGVLPWESPTFIPRNSWIPCGAPAIRRQRIAFGPKDAPVDHGAWYTVCAWHGQDDPHEDASEGFVWTERDGIGFPEYDFHAQVASCEINSDFRSRFYVEPGPRCAHCETSLTPKATGRPAKFCSTRCRVAAHRAAKAG